MLSPGEVARLDTLIPPARAAHDTLIAAMTARGMEPFIGACARSEAQQAAAVASGASSKNEKVDWHEIRRAVDYRARLADGSEDLTTHNEPFFRALYEETQKIPGMRSLAYHADGTKLLLNGHTWDAGHVEYRLPYATLLAAVQAEAPELLV